MNFLFDYFNLNYSYVYLNKTLVLINNTKTYPLKRLNQMSLLEKKIYLNIQHKNIKCAAIYNKILS